MRKFETLLLLSPELSADAREGILNTLKEVVEREGGARQIVVRDTDKLGDYKEASDDGTSGGGLKDILAKASDDGAGMGSGDVPPPTDSGMEANNRPDQRDAVADAWIRQQAKER